MGISKTTSFRQRAMRHKLLRRYAKAKGHQFSFTEFFDQVLQPALAAAEGKGPDPFPNLWGTLTLPDEPLDQESENP